PARPMSQRNHCCQLIHSIKSARFQRRKFIFSAKSFTSCSISASRLAVIFIRTRRSKSLVVVALSLLISISFHLPDRRSSNSLLSVNPIARFLGLGLEVLNSRAIAAVWLLTKELPDSHRAPS